MNTKDEMAKAAWENINICCQTLCHKDPVIDYILYLENRIKELENGSDRINESKSET